MPLATGRLRWPSVAALILLSLLVGAMALPGTQGHAPGTAAPSVELAADDASAVILRGPLRALLHEPGTPEPADHTDDEPPPWPPLAALVAEPPSSARSEALLAGVARWLRPRLPRGQPQSPRAPPLTFASLPS
jgi:hypothetical protein